MLKGKTSPITLYRSFTVETEQAHRRRVRRMWLKRSLGAGLLVVALAAPSPIEHMHHRQHRAQPVDSSQRAMMH